MGGWVAIYAHKKKNNFCLKNINIIYMIILSTIEQIKPVGGYQAYRKKKHTNIYENSDDIGLPVQGKENKPRRRFNQKVVYILCLDRSTFPDIKILGPGLTVTDPNPSYPGTSISRTNQRLTSQVQPVSQDCTARESACVVG